MRYELGCWVVTLYPEGGYDLHVRREDGTLVLRDWDNALTPTNGLVVEVIMSGEATEC